jgi:acylphosphatase
MDAGMDEGKARRFYVSGGVQGVGYRFFVRHTARRLGLAGYVRNLLDGRVEVYAVGTVEQLRQLVGELRRGPQHAVVEDVEMEEAESLREFSSAFTITD